MKNLFIFPVLLLWAGIGFSQNDQPQAEAAFITEAGDPFEEQVIDGVVERRIIVENRVLPYEPVREADVPWEKKIWSVINVREKINLPFAYPKMPFFTILADAAKNGEFSVYKDDDFKDIMTVSELEGKLFSVDTVSVTDPETYEVTLAITRSDLNPSDIQRFRVKEVVFFDKKASRVKRRILGIAPIKDVIDKTTGQLLYPEPLFWVYYPQAREALSKYRVFNAENDAAPMTWDMVLEEHMFSSYIFKESNVMDRRLQDYLTGVDILYESQKIKDRLFNFEQDLWEY
ncbi:MAG: gliding motility protein GldN [Lewinellaceae bacterium]|nr:gliding motility protein GldN [Lewinellaceae bacterium]